MKRRRLHRLSIWLCYLSILGLGFDHFIRETIWLDDISLCVLYAGLLMYSLTLPYKSRMKLSLILLIAVTVSFLVMVVLSFFFGLLMLFCIFLLELSGFFRDPKEGLSKRKRNKRIKEE